MDMFESPHTGEVVPATPGKNQIAGAEGAGSITIQLASKLVLSGRNQLTVNRR